MSLVAAQFLRTLRRRNDTFHLVTLRAFTTTKKNTNITAGCMQAQNEKELCLIRTSTTMANEQSNTTTRALETRASHDDEDDDAWVPLLTDEKGSDNPQTSTRSRDSVPPEPSSTRQPNSDSLQVIQRRLETRINLKQNLVDHPIDLFWKRFLVNLAREIWELEIHIRLGLIMIITGIVLKLFLLSTWYFWYPRLAILSLVFTASIIYLDPFDVKAQLDRIGQIIFSPDKAAEAIERLDTTQFRKLSVFLLMIPTVLEMRTISFLSQIKAESGWM
jgi:hypothetical protein